jgi:predicted metal-dependent HD superfamily phosphohydrolase
VPAESVRELPVDENYLAERFCKLWVACAGENTEQVWRKLRRHYREPHRYYHTLAHLAHCLRELDLAKEHVVEFNATEMAIWFHDVIYHYGARDNEILSVAYFRQLAESTMSMQFIKRVSEFIIATQHTGVAADGDVAFAVDIDLSGFGLPWEAYLADSDALRKEAGSISDEQYYQGKLRFLSELQRWPSLFQSPFFRHRLESTAQSNIARYTDDLRREGFGEFVICQA